MNVSLVCYEFNSILLCLQVFLCIRVKSIRPNIVTVSIPQANISEDDLQTSSGSDDDFDASSDESIDYELTEEEIIESGSEFEQDNTEEPPSSNSHIETKFNWDNNMKWTIPQDFFV